MALTAGEKKRLKARYGPWAVVSGASSGIGREIAASLAEAGLNLVVNGRNEDILNDFSATLRSRHGVAIEVVAADLSDATGINHILNKTGALDVGLFVASAGFGSSGNFILADLDTELNMIQINCSALLAMTHHFANKFVRRKGGGIILLSSIVGFQGAPLAGNYAATKAYVQSLGEALYRELKPLGVDVLCAAPGPVATGFSERANMEMDNAQDPAKIAQEIIKNIGRRQTVLPGNLTKFLMYSLAMLPRRGRTSVMRLVMGGMAKHPQTPVTDQ